MKDADLLIEGLNPCTQSATALYGACEQSVSDHKITKLVRAGERIDAIAEFREKSRPKKVIPQHSD